MFDPIRQLISQNKLRQALDACGELTLSASNRSQLIALRRRWDMLAADKIGNTREERLIRIDENQLVQDLLAWLDFMDSDLPAKKTENAAQVPEPPEPPKKSSLKRIGLILLLLVGAVFGGKYLINQFGEGDGPTKQERTPVTEQDIRDRITTNSELESPSRETLTPVSRDGSTTGRLMTAGPKVKLTVAVYVGRRSTTSYQDELTKQVARYLSALQSYVVPTDVLTNTFHTSKERESINLSDSISNPPPLNANRTLFLLLIDIRNIDREGKGYLNLSIYDVARKKPIRKGSDIKMEDLDAKGAKQLARDAHEYLQRMKENGLFK